MSSNQRNPPGTRDGFTWSYDRFYVDPGRVERVEGSSLREMFLPRQSREGQRMRDKIHDFIPGQLKHYGIPFETSDISGRNELTFFKKALEAGKLDKVPEHISQLRNQLHSEWLSALTPRELSNDPELAMKRYFLTSGQPDRKKTTNVVGLPFEPRSQYHAGKMREIASKVAGLHQATGWGPTTQKVFLGWNSAAVNKAAKDHAKAEEEESQAAARAKEAERTSMHAEYLRGVTGRKGAKNRSKTDSPAGSYMVDCEDIEEEYPDAAKDLSIDIRPADEPGVFEASFDFGILEGAMIIGADEKAVAQHCAQLDRQGSSKYYDESGEEDDAEDEDDDEKPTISSKRKAKAPAKPRGRPPKKVRTASTTTRAYHLRLKCRETGEGEIYTNAEKGTIKFEGPNMASFAGNVDLPCLGRGVVFTARKIGDVPSGYWNSWEEFSEEQYESARTGRW